MGDLHLQSKVGREAPSIINTKDWKEKLLVWGKDVMVKDLVILSLILGNHNITPPTLPLLSLYVDNNGSKSSLDLEYGVRVVWKEDGSSHLFLLSIPIEVTIPKYSPLSNLWGIRFHHAQSWIKFVTYHHNLVESVSLVDIVGRRILENVGLSKTNYSPQFFPKWNPNLGLDFSKQLNVVLIQASTHKDLRK